MLWRLTAEEATQLLCTTEDAVKPLRSGGRQRRAARLAHQRTAMQQARCISLVLPPPSTLALPLTPALPSVRPWTRCSQDVDGLFPGAQGAAQG